jgi:hypothetical protein
MGDKLESAKYTLARAKLHIADFEKQVSLFLDTRPYEKAIEVDPDTGEHVLKLRFTKPFPAMLNGIASDAIVNLRSALDQCGYAVAVANGGRGRDCYFPFHDDAAGVMGHRKAGSKEIPDEIFAVMASFEPHKGGNDFLWCLNELSNANKHRIVSPMAVAVGTGRVRASMSGSVNLDLPKRLEWDRGKNEIELGRSTGKGRLKYKLNIQMFVALDEIEPASTVPAEAVLHGLALTVESIIGAVEAEAIRIGLFK